MQRDLRARGLNMARQKTGSISRHGDHFDVRVSVGGGKRLPPIHLPASYSEAQAREAARKLSAMAAQGELVQASAPAGGSLVTVGEWFGRWFDDRKARGIVTAEGERGRFTKWAAQLLLKPMVAVAPSDLEQLVETLDRASQSHAKAEREGTPIDRSVMLAWKTAFNVWGIVRQGFADAHRSKTLALRVLSKNPAEGVRGPDMGAKKARSYLTPSTFAAFVGCASVPVQWRRIVALAVYTYTRASELRGLEWSDVHLEEGFILVHRTRNAAGEGGTTKSERPRRVPIEPALVPLLEAMRAESGGAGQVVELIDDRHLARALRTWLRLPSTSRRRQRRAYRSTTFGRAGSPGAPFEATTRSASCIQLATRTWQPPCVTCGKPTCCAKGSEQSFRPSPS